MSNEGKMVDLVKNFNNEIDNKIKEAEQLLVRAVNYSKAENTSLTEMYEVVIRAKEVEQGLSVLKQLENSWVEVANKKANQSEDDKRLVKELVIETTMVYEKFAAIMIDLNGILAKNV